MILVETQPHKRFYWFDDYHPLEGYRRTAKSPFGIMQATAVARKILRDKNQHDASNRERCLSPRSTRDETGIDHCGPRWLE